jgi:hypothetical protein
VTTAEIIRNAAAAGITLAARGDQLSVKPAARLSPDLRLLLIAHKTELLAYLRQPANDSAPRCRAWLIRFADGTGCIAVNTTAADEIEMLAIARDQFGAARVFSIEGRP